MNPTQIDWFWTGAIGISTSIIGSLIFWIFQRILRSYSKNKRLKKISDLRKEHDRFEGMHENTNKLIVYFLGTLFYVLFLMTADNAMVHLSYLIGFPEILLSLIRMSIMIAATLICVRSFMDLIHIKNFPGYSKRVIAQIAELEKKNES